MRKTVPGHIESEIAFVITQDGRSISKNIAGVKSLLQYDLVPRAIVRIRDTYYDTQQGLLRRRRVVLRIRQVDHATLITLKSNPQRLKGGGVERTEIELPWSRESLLEAVERLKLKERRTGRERFSRLSPKDSLARYDLRTVQERRTIRTIRNIVSKGRKQPILAELALDRTTFFFPSARIRIYEVEIEAKNTRTFRPVQKIADAIFSMYPKRLRYWVHGKFVTGLAISELLRNREFQRHLVRNELQGAAFPLINRRIRSSRLDAAI